MLKNIDPIITPDLLYTLASMGHGDDLVICDTNFPARSVAQLTMVKTPLELPGISAARAVRAILSVMPLDTFVDHPAQRMEVVGQPDEIPEVQREVQAEIDRAEGRSWPMGSIERFAFYEAAKKSFAVVRAGEGRFYGCFLLKMGVIAPK
ncbi:MULTISPECIES: RbsD/FucU family protein [Inquilinus]|jgi:L-fucose mutarotase|uniref:L-fucose mutarotase n=1 Tax=Inquilinus ginsengisoli TaxID=363840 RepID=A0ABU1JJZ1_9PROT|nr:RbsD/FucU family protein [Inquilinus ginsengisoli]MDR6288932.1 L-fucose mutarotase [Inquilinus ginsengisoli]